MRLFIAIPFVLILISVAAWLAVHAAVSLDSRHFPFAYLWSFLGITVLTCLFALLGESLIEDAIKAGLAVLLLGTRLPALIPCIAITAALVASATNQLLKKRHGPRA